MTVAIVAVAKGLSNSTPPAKVTVPVIGMAWALGLNSAQLIAPAGKHRENCFGKVFHFVGPGLITSFCNRTLLMEEPLALSGS